MRYRSASSRFGSKAREARVEGACPSCEPAGNCWRWSRPSKDRPSSSPRTFGCSHTTFTRRGRACGFDRCLAKPLCRVYKKTLANVVVEPAEISPSRITRSRWSLPRRPGGVATRQTRQGPAGSRHAAARRGRSAARGGGRRERVRPRESAELGGGLGLRSIEERVRFVAGGSRSTPRCAWGSPSRSG